MRDKLTSKQAKFAVIYVKTDKASEAYKKAGYSYENMLPATINRNAHALLKNNNVATRIAELRSDIDKKDLYTLSRILNEFGNVAFANIIDIFDFVKEGNKMKITLTGGVTRLSELPRKITACIKGFKETAAGFEVTLRDPDNALAQIARIKGYYAPDKILNITSTFADLLKPPEEDDNIEDIDFNEL